MADTSEIYTDPLIEIGAAFRKRDDQVRLVAATSTSGGIVINGPNPGGTPTAMMKASERGAWWSLGAVGIDWQLKDGHTGALHGADRIGAGGYITLMHQRPEPTDGTSAKRSYVYLDGEFATLGYDRPDGGRIFIQADSNGAGLIGGGAFVNVSSNARCYSFQHDREIVLTELPTIRTQYWSISFPAGLSTSSIAFGGPTFGTPAFKQPPTVVVSHDAADPSTVSLSASAVTTTGFTLRAKATAAITVNVTYQAIGI